MESYIYQINDYFSKKIIKPNIVLLLCDFNYNNTQIIFIKKTNNINDCHVCIFNDNCIAYIYDNELFDDYDNIPMKEMCIIRN